MPTVYHLFPGATLRGTVALPASKSIPARALLLARLAGGGWTVENAARCDDTAALRHGLATADTVVDVGAAGTAMRFLTAWLCTQPGTRVITGSERMRQRPIGILVDALRRMGADIRYEAAEGFPPLRITGGKLRGGELKMPASVSSQYVSALLMIAPGLSGGLRLHLTGHVASRPYIDMTLALMRRFGAQAGWTDTQTLRVAEGPYASEGHFAVEADWSAASYWYELVALTPDSQARVELPGLTSRSLQGDAVVSRLFEPLGVQSEFTPTGVTLTKGTAAAQLPATDFSDCPDLAQTLVVACAMAGRPFRFTGLASLKIKETDRTAALCRELARLGVTLREEGDDTLQWDGTRQPAEATPVIATYDDHRMAMAFAPAALRHAGLGIAAPGVVSKSYPGFWTDYARLLGSQAIEETEAGTKA